MIELASGRRRYYLGLLPRQAKSSSNGRVPPCSTFYRGCLHILLFLARQLGHDVLHLLAVVSSAELALLGSIHGPARLIQRIRVRVSMVMAAS